MDCWQLWRFDSDLGLFTLINMMCSFQQDLVKWFFIYEAASDGVERGEGEWGRRPSQGGIVTRVLVYVLVTRVALKSSYKKFRYSGSIEVFIYLPSHVPPVHPTRLAQGKQEMIERALTLEYKRTVVVYTCCTYRIPTAGQPHVATITVLCVRCHCVPTTPHRLACRSQTHTLRFSFNCRPCCTWWTLAQLPSHAMCK